MPTRKLVLQEGPSLDEILAGTWTVEIAGVGKEDQKDAIYQTTALRRLVLAYAHLNQTKTGGKGIACSPAKAFQDVVVDKAGRRISAQLAEPETMPLSHADPDYVAKLPEGHAVSVKASLPVFNSVDLLRRRHSGDCPYCGEFVSNTTRAVVNGQNSAVYLCRCGRYSLPY